MSIAATFLLRRFQSGHEVEGLHILNMHRKMKSKDGTTVYENTATKDGKFIKVDAKVIAEMERLRRPSNNVQLCYTPIYTINQCVTILFHNSRSLHGHFCDMSSDPNFTSANVICCSESPLVSFDEDATFTIPGFTQFRFIDNITIGHMSNICTPHYEWCCIRLKSRIGHLQLICLYTSLKTTWAQFGQKAIDELMSTVTHTESIIILGDFNQLVDSAFPMVMGQQHGLRQLIDLPTTVYRSCIDLVFTIIASRAVKTGVIDTCWSDCRIV